MKVKVRKWKCSDSKTEMLDAWFLWVMGRMPGTCFERICLRKGKDHWLYKPSHHGKHCPSSGWYPGIECRCDECHAYLECWPDWQELVELSDEEKAKIFE